ncbi:hypothetical protein [Chthonobacter rhizosphaerae]|uniref:hypothetical protein n=1 Tax=Chthonobacter rhizosphaerae TaxID=2735553 RepID=UPI0015EEFA6C|nr:hypothetical protein [Chthonobacter rhizosphaerae]
MRNLVIVRAGAGSLHPAWLTGERNFDVIVSRYDPALEVAPGRGVTVHDAPGGKWRGLHSTITEHYDTVMRYDSIWLPDDDLATNAATINELFEIHRAFKLELSQPSLSDQSYYTHPVTMNHPAFFIRFTNFVEIMMPLFSRGLLQRVWSDFEHSNSGWGFDVVWPSVTQFPRVAIVDALTVTHTRPLRGSTGSGGSNQAKTSDREQQEYLSRRFFTSPRVKQNVTLAGILKDGSIGSLTDPQAIAFLATVLSSSRYLANEDILGYAQYCKNTLEHIDQFRQLVSERALEAVMKDALPELEMLRAKIAMYSLRKAS